MLKLTEKDKICLDALEETCKKYEKENDYCIGEPTEQKVCLCKREDNWEVFILEHGLELDKEKFKECIEACLEVLNQCSYSIDEFNDATNEFKNILITKKQVKLLKKCKQR